MSEFILDLTGYKDTTSAHVPEGRYKVVVEDAETTTSNKINADTGKPSPGVIVYLRITEGDFAGSTLIDRLWITPRSLFRIVGFMNAIGLPTPKKRLKVNLQTWMGKVLEVDVEDGDPYNGRVKSEVRGYSRMAGASQERTEQRDLDDLTTNVENSEAAPAEPVTAAADPEPTPEPVRETVPPTASEPESVDLDTLDLG